MYPRSEVFRESDSEDDLTDMTRGFRTVRPTVVMLPCSETMRRTHTGAAVQPAARPARTVEAEWEETVMAAKPAAAQVDEPAAAAASATPHRSSVEEESAPTPRATRAPHLSIAIPTPVLPATPAPPSGPSPARPSHRHREVSESRGGSVYVTF
jgi:hypothetical protein